MKRKFLSVFLMFSIISLAIAPAAFAGASFDIGNVPGFPPEGTINWTAWHSGSLQPGGYPNQIMTEDSTNSSQGTNKGYSIFGGLVRWILIVSNFNAPAATANVSTVTVLLGGLGAYSGSLWSSSFVWNTGTSTTDHGDASPFTGTGVCPSLTSGGISGDQQKFNWTGPAGKYHVYRSGNASGADNGASNGRYLYIATTNTDPSGSGTYTDTYSGQAWYIVIHATEAGAIDGCHSEEVSPTAIVLSDFIATPQPAIPSVLLKWETGNEVDVVGFNLYRAESLAGVQIKLNADLIPAQFPGQINEGLYTYEDTTVQPGLTYYYWVEAVKQFGPSEIVGPQIANLGYSVYLPKVQR